MPKGRVSPGSIGVGGVVSARQHPAVPRRDAQGCSTCSAVQDAGGPSLSLTRVLRSRLGTAAAALPAARQLPWVDEQLPGVQG